MKNSDSHYFPETVASRVARAENSGCHYFSEVVA
jgi:hypothetical protein